MSDSPTQDVLVKLEGAVRDVSEWLDMKMRTGQYSIGLVVELAQHLVGQGYNVHTIYDEISILEGDDRRASLTKAAAPFRRPPLLGLWHKHHHQARFMSQNLLLELEQDGAVEDALAPYCGRRVEEAAGQIVHELVMKTFARRAAENDRRIHCV
jgi:hypothetical protein